MRILTLFFISSLLLVANNHPYKKEISFENSTVETIVRVKLDKEIYMNTEEGYASVRLESINNEEGYFIEEAQVKNIMNHKRLIATSYERDKAKLNYRFKKSFEVEELFLNIEDQNFESFVDIYVDGTLVSEGNKIFDYSNETGTRNFRIKITKQKVKELSLIYHIDKTTTFYKKYKNIRQKRQYLSIKSVDFSNDNKVKSIFDKHYVELLSFETRNKVSSYIFKVDNVPSERLEFLVHEKNFKREARLYISNDEKSFTFLKSFSLLSSSFDKSTKLRVDFKNRTQYIKIELENKDNKPLHIEGINILMKPSYLYFIAESNENYTLYYGNKNLEEPNYELRSIVQNRDSVEVGTFAKAEELEVSSFTSKIPFVKKHKKILFTLLLLVILGIMSYIAFILLKRVEPHHS